MFAHRRQIRIVSRTAAAVLLAAALQSAAATASEWRAVTATESGFTGWPQVRPEAIIEDSDSTGDAVPAPTARQTTASVRATGRLLSEEQQVASPRESEPIPARDRDSGRSTAALPTLSVGVKPASTPDPLADLPGAAAIGRMATATGVLVVIAAVALAVFKHLRGAAKSRAETERGLKLHGSIALGARNGLHLVSVTDRQFLVAVDARGVSCITAVAAPFEELCADEDDSQQPLPVSSFPNLSPAGRA